MLYVSQILSIVLLTCRNNLNTVLKTIAIGISLSLTVPLLVQAKSYTIDPSHSFVKFETSHLGVSKLSGRFNKIVGKLMYDPAAGDGSQSVEVSIDTLQLLRQTLRTEDDESPLAKRWSRKSAPFRGDIPAMDTSPRHSVR